MKVHHAICCGVSLSEWFIDPLLGMRCLLCGRIWPFFTHAEFIETQKERTKSNTYTNTKG